MNVFGIDSDNSIVLKQLKGHSGCYIDLMYDITNNYKFVRKSSEESYSNRLCVQLSKQQTFALSHINDNKIDAPLVLEQDTDSMSVFYMDYIPGKTLAEAIDTMPIDNIKHYGKILHSYFDKALAQSKFVQLEANNSLEINKKLDSIYNATLKIQNTTIDKNCVIETIEYLRNALSTVNIYINECDDIYCHGDFTLENMIVSNNKLYLIDFLDSYINCIEIDYAKILQDVLLGWSYRFKKESAGRQLRLSILFNEIIDIYKQHKTSIDLMLLVNVLRIVPYCKQNDDITANWLNKKIKFLLTLNKDNLCQNQL